MHDQQYGELKMAVSSLARQMALLSAKLDEAFPDIASEDTDAVTIHNDDTRTRQLVIDNNYDLLTVSGVQQLAAGLPDYDRRLLLAYERANKNRRGAIEALEG